MYFFLIGSIFWLFFYICYSHSITVNLPGTMHEFFGLYRFVYLCGFILFLTIPLRFLFCEIFHKCSTLQIARMYDFTCNSVDLPFGKFPCFCSSVCTESLTNEVNFVQWNLVFDQDPVDIGPHSLKIGGRLSIVHCCPSAPINQQHVVLFLSL